MVRDRRPTDRAMHCLAMVESSAEAVIGIDQDGMIVSWNSGAEHLYHHGVDAVGSHISLVIPPEHAEEYYTLFERAGRGQPVCGHETAGLTKSGSCVDVALTVSPIPDAEGDIIGVSIFAHDICEQRWMAAALDSTLAEVENALAAAREADASSQRFLADAAQHLRQPITEAHACGEALLHDPDEVDRHRLLGELLRETTRAKHGLASLVQLARIDQGLGVTPSSCDVMSLCRCEVDRMSVLAPHLDFVLRSDLADSRVVVDPDVASEVVTKILDNARRHAATTIEMVIGQPEGWLQIRVADDGPGMEPRAAERAFQRFVSLDAAGGAGLGLPIARGLARAHGGELTYEPPEFVLRLPLPEAREVPGADAARPSS